MRKMGDGCVHGVSDWDAERRVYVCRACGHDHGCNHAATAMPADPEMSDDEIPHRPLTGGIRVQARVGKVRRGAPGLHPDDLAVDARDAAVATLRQTLEDRQRYLHAELHVDERGHPDGVWADCGRPTCTGTRAALAAAPAPGA